MKRMVLRFFAYIWGAILGTALLVIMLTVWLGLPPPGHIPIIAVEGILQTAAEAAYAREGLAGVERLLASDPSFSENFTLEATPAPDCSGTNVVAGDGTTCLRVSANEDSLPRVGLFVPFLTPMMIGLFISLAVALLLARRFVRPIERLGDGLRDLSRGNLDRRMGSILDNSEPAIADVGRAFDVAAAKLQDLTENRSRLFHDISHEIRSPLARFQAATGLLRQNPTRLDALLPRMEGDILRMNQLIEEILTLARLEREARPSGLLPVDLIDILDPILRDARLEGQPRGVAITYTGPDHAVIKGDPELLHRAFENILRNALRFSPDNSRVAVEVVTTDTAVTPRIRDQGPGVDESLLPSIFNAFVHGDTGSGVGLGLAIAGNAVRLHEGEIHAVNLPEGGLEVRCDFPKAGFSDAE